MATTLAQLPALFGVVIGAVATILATSLADRSQWKRSQAARWDQRRLEAYAQYAEAVKHLQVLANRLSAPTRPGAKSQPLERETGAELMAEGEIARAKAWESVLLLGDSATVAAGRAWRDAVLHQQSVARGLADGVESWSELDRIADQARERYYAAARASLGVGGQNPLITRARVPAES